MAAILKITPKKHFRNGNSIGDMSGLEKHGKTFINKLVLEDHGGGVQAELFYMSDYLPSVLTSNELIFKK